MKKQPEITAATKKVFIDAFCALYAAAPIEKITVKEIAEKAGYNRTTFYLYFQDVYSLLTSLEDEAIACLTASLEANLKQIDFAGSFIQSFSNLGEKTESRLEVLLGNPGSTKFAERAKAAMMPVLLQHFGIAESDEKAVFVLDFYLAGLISVSGLWFRTGQTVPTGEMGRLIYKLLTEGVLSALGQNGQSAR